MPPTPPCARWRMASARAFAYVSSPPIAVAEAATLMVPLLVESHRGIARRAGRFRELRDRGVLEPFGGSSDDRACGRILIGRGGGPGEDVDRSAVGQTDGGQAQIIRRERVLADPDADRGISRSAAFAARECMGACGDCDGPVCADRHRCRSKVAAMGALNDSPVHRSICVGVARGRACIRGRGDGDHAGVGQIDRGVDGSGGGGGESRLPDPVADMGACAGEFGACPGGVRKDVDRPVDAVGQARGRISRRCAERIRLLDDAVADAGVGFAHTAVGLRRRGNRDGAGVVDGRGGRCRSREGVGDDRDEARSHDFCCVAQAVGVGALSNSSADIGGGLGEALNWRSEDVGSERGRAGACPDGDRTGVRQRVAGNRKAGIGAGACILAEFRLRRWRRPTRRSSRARSRRRRP